MIRSIPDVLVEIVEHKRTELEDLRARVADLERLAVDSISDRRDFRTALIANPPSILAEFKKASPSKGWFAPNADPAVVARQYEAGGAAAMSILTDRKYFRGSLDDLETARSFTHIPLLRKDFTIDEMHVVEAAAHGADAILLIAAILSEQQIARFLKLASEFRLACLVEVHEEDELERALAAGAEILGVNNRNLRTFEVTLETSLRLAERIPANLVRVAESGIHSALDIRRLREAGFHAFLVGEHLMTAPDPAAALRALRQ